MGQWRAFLLRLLGMFRGRACDEDFAAELEAHIELDTDAGISAGLGPEEARRRALVRLGGAEQTRQAHRERRTLPWLDALLQDTRYGMRTLRRSPGFTTAAVLTLALGIGACTSIFSLVNAVLLRSLPYGEPQQLVYLFTPNPHIPIPPDVITPGWADFYDLKRQSQSFADMTAFQQAMVHAGSGGPVERMGAARVDERFFATLKSFPQFGRAIEEDDNLPGHERVVVISHALWRSMFAGAADILGRSMLLDGVAYKIIGVMPPSFQYPSNFDLPYGDSSVKTTEIWLPLALTAKQKAVREPGDDEVVARLRPGVSINQAQSEMSTLMARLDKLHTEDLNGWGALVKGFLDRALGPVRHLMWLLLAAVSLVLLISCGNAASLLLARAANRTREMGVRVALGAGRGRITRQVLTESMLIGVAAGVLGVFLSYCFLRVLPYLNPGNIPRLNEASLDMRVMFFTVLVCLLTSLLTGMLPAWSVSRLNPVGLLSSAAGGAVAGTRNRTQSALIVMETSLVVVLLACSGLLLRSYWKVVSVDTGFSPSTITMNIGLERYAQPQQRSAFFKDAVARIGNLPGVGAVGGINYLPLTHSESMGYFWVDGSAANRKDQMAQGRSVTPGYFSAMNIPLIAGRFFTEDDVSSGSRPTIINQRFAKLYFASRSAVGGRISTDDKHAEWDTVVGVVADVRYSSLEEAAPPQMYLAGYEGGSMVVRATQPPSMAVAEVRATLKQMDPNLALTDVHTMGDLVSQASAQRRFQTWLLTVFAAIALLLAMVGVYGLMAYSVSRRTREVGVRMALGAQRSDITLLVLKKAAWLLGLGLAAGIGCAWIATRAIKAFLFGVGEHDAAVMVLVCGVLAVCGLVAAIIPARRAAAVDPVQALRTE